MTMKLGWLIVNTRECCASTLIYVGEIMAFMMLISINATNTPCDMIALLGAGLAGFILGMCLFGEDGQLHSQIFMGFAITGFVLLFSLGS